MHFIIFFLEFVFKTFQNVMKFYYIAHVHVTVPVIKILIFFVSLIFFSVDCYGKLFTLYLFYSGWLKRPLRQEKKWGILSEPSQYPSLVKPTKLQR